MQIHQFELYIPQDMDKYTEENRLRNIPNKYIDTLQDVNGGNDWKDRKDIDKLAFAFYDISDQVHIHWDTTDFYIHNNII